MSDGKGTDTKLFSQKVIIENKEKRQTYDDRST